MNVFRCIFNAYMRICLVIITVTMTSFIYYYIKNVNTPAAIPMVINTWAFTGATSKSNCIMYIIIIKAFKF